MSTSKRSEREETHKQAGAQAETTIEAQIEALRELGWYFVQAADNGRRQVSTLVESDDKEEVRTALREISQAVRREGRGLHESRKRLVATGYDCPDRWLTLRIEGRYHWRGFRDSTDQAHWRYVLEYDRPDLEAIEAVRDEIRAAILRLESAPETPSTEVGAGKPEPMTDSQQAVYNILNALPPGECLTGKEILEKLPTGHRGMDSSTLTSHVIPVLKRSHGVKNKRGAGYYIDRQ